MMDDIMTFLCRQLLAIDEDDRQKQRNEARLYFKAQSRDLIVKKSL